MGNRLATILGLSLLALVLLITAGVIYYRQPTTLKVAVSPSDPEDFDLVTAAAKLLKQRHHGLRFKLVTTEDVGASAAALDASKVDLAVVRADVAMPAKGETVVLTHKDAALLLAPAGSGIEKVEDLAGKRVGLLSSRPGDAQLLTATLTQYEIARDKVEVVPLDIRAVDNAVASNSVDAVFVVGPVSDGLVPETVRAVTKGGRGPPVFIPVGDAPAMAQLNASYESIEVLKGTFGGGPSRPADDLTTLGVTYRLVASTDLNDRSVGALTRFLLAQRVALSQMAPSASRMEAPTTAKGAQLPAHPGTAAYIDDKEEGFLDGYSDYIYIGAMLIGVVASAITALAGRFGAQGAARVEDLLAQLLDLLRQVRGTTSLGQLDALEHEVDEIVVRALDHNCLRTLDERRVAALNMGLEQVRAALRDRRDTLGRALEGLAAREKLFAFEAETYVLRAEPSARSPVGS